MAIIRLEDEEFKQLAIFEKGVTKQYGENIIVPGTFVLQNKKKILSVSPMFDSSLGGLPEGSWVTLAGPPGCGKTTLALNIGASAQADGRLVFYIDAEGRLKVMNLEGVEGLNAEQVRIIRSTEDRQLTGEDYLNIGTNILKAHRGSVLIIDSASALCAANEMTSEVTGSSRSANPKTLGNFCRKNAGIVSTMNNVVIIIKHVISNTSGYGSPWMEDGGVKVKYQADIQLRTTKSPEMWEENKSIVGQIVEWDVLKYALPLKNNVRKFKTYIRYGVGVDKLTETIQLALDYGIIDAAGAWYSFEIDGQKQKFQGQAKLYEGLKQDTKSLISIQEQVSAISGT